MISHALCPLHTPAFIITEIPFYWSEFSGLEISTACSFQGVNFVQKFLGFGGSATDFFVFDFCLDLIIPVTWNLKYPPLWLWIFVYDYGKPNSKALASQGGDLVHMSISRLSSKCIACFVFFYWMLDAILTGMCFRFKQHCGIHIMWRSLSCRLWLHNITRECDIVCSRNLF